MAAVGHDTSQTAIPLYPGLFHTPFSIRYFQCGSSLRFLLRNAAVLFTWLSAMILNLVGTFCARGAHRIEKAWEKKTRGHTVGRCEGFKPLTEALTSQGSKRRAPLRAQVRNLHAKSSCGGPGYLVEEGTPLTLFVTRWSSWRHNRGGACGPIGVLNPLRSISRKHGGGRASARCRPWLPRLVAAHQPTPSRASTARHGSGGGAHRRHRFGHRRPLLCVPAGAVRPAPWLHRVSHLPWPTATQRGSLHVLLGCCLPAGLVQEQCAVRPRHQRAGGQAARPCSRSYTRTHRRVSELQAGASRWSSRTSTRAAARTRSSGAPRRAPSSSTRALRSGAACRLRRSTRCGRCTLTTCTRHVHCMCTACALHVHGICTACARTLHVHCMCMVGARHRGRERRARVARV